MSTSHSAKDLAVLRNIRDVALALAANADAAELNLIVGRFADRGFDSAGHPVAHTCNGRCLKKFASIGNE